MHMASGRFVSKAALLSTTLALLAGGAPVAQALRHPVPHTRGAADSDVDAAASDTAPPRSKPVSDGVLPGRLSALPFALKLTGRAETVTVAGDSLTVVAPPGSDLYAPAGGPAKDTAPRVTFTPQGDFIFSARVTRPDKGKYEGGALIISASPDHWAKILFERLNDATHAVSSSVADPVSDNSYHMRLPASVAAVWLKIVRVGGSVMLYASEDGKRWEILRDFPLAASAAVDVGFVGQSPGGGPFAARFSDVHYQATSLKDYWQGT